VLAFGAEIGISEEQAENYFQRNEDNGWFDTKHNPIINWKKAMAGYFKKIKESNTDDDYYSTPRREPIPIPPILKPVVEKIVNKNRVYEVEESRTNDDYCSTPKPKSVLEPPPTLEQLLEIVNNRVCEQLGVEQQEARKLTEIFFERFIANDWHKEDNLARKNLTNNLYAFIKNNKAPKT